MKNEKKIKELLEGSEDSYIIATKNGTGVVGYNYEVLTLLTVLVKSVKECKGIDDKAIEKVFRLSKATEKELAEEMLKTLKDMISKLGE